MLNLAGDKYNFAAVTYAVLDECEHRRRSLDAEDAPEALRVIAAEKLAQIRRGYDEMEGSPQYWRALEREVLENAVPQYVPAAVAMNRLENEGYGIWRGGDILSRATFALAGLALGGLIIATPFIPIVEDAFAFALALGAWFYPDLRRATLSYRHNQLLNRIIQEAESYQHKQLKYMSEEELAAELELVAPSTGGAETRSTQGPLTAPATEQQRSAAAREAASKTGHRQPS